MNLLEIPKRLTEIDNLIDEHQGEITPEIDKMIQEYEIKTPVAFIGAVNWYEDQMAKHKAFKERSKILKEKAEHQKKKADRIKQLMIYALHQIGKKKIETDGVSLTLSNTKPSVIIEDEKQIPDKYKKVIVSIDKAIFERVFEKIPCEIIDTKVDKKAIYEDHKNGVGVSGVTIEQGETLRIRG